jgi:hypothetical protein
LAALGIRKGATPALQSQVGRLTALLPSIELARDELRTRGPTLDEKAVHRISSQLGAEVLATRTRDLRRWRGGALPAGQEMAGQHVVAETDGGRVRIRTQVETTKRKGVKYRRKIRVACREPKLLILSLSDRKGRMIKGTRPWIDGTMGGPDHLMERLAFHLHRLGAARAKAVSFVSDGAPWIGNRLDWVVGRAGLDPKRVERVLDCSHAAHHVSLALQALGLPEAQRTATYRTLRHQLRAGRSRELVAALRRMAQAEPVDSGVWVEIAYLEKHEAHLRYDWFQYRGRPLGSGAVESAIRRVINLRLKGNGIDWREENAEGMLVLRAAALTGRWEETMERSQAAMAVDRRRDWSWEAPDIVAELNSGVAIKPPAPQPQPLERFTFGLQTGRIPEELIADDTGGWSRRRTSWVPTRRIFATGSRRRSIMVRAPNVRSPGGFASASPSSSACSGAAAMPALSTPSHTAVARPPLWALMISNASTDSSANDPTPPWSN